MQEKSYVDIVIVNWNSGSLLSSCIRSIIVCDPIASRVQSISVVDNASCDGSAKLEDIRDDRLAVIRNKTNLGFAYGCNQAANIGEADYILFLNPDTELEEEALNKAVEVLEQDPNIGIVGISLKNEDGDVSRTCSYFPSPASLLIQSLGLNRLFPKLFKSHFMTDWDHSDTRCVDQVMGAFMLMRRRDFVELKGFDDRFFVYMEDVDLSLRAREMGLKSIYLSSASAVHIGCGTTNAIAELRNLYLLRARLLYALKHFHLSGIALTLISQLLFEPALRTLKALSNKDIQQARKYVRIWWWLIRNFPYARSEQRGKQKI